MHGSRPLLFIVDTAAFAFAGWWTFGARRYWRLVDAAILGGTAGVYALYILEGLGIGRSSGVAHHHHRTGRRPDRAVAGAGADTVNGRVRVGRGMDRRRPPFPWP